MPTSATLSTHTVHELRRMVRGNLPPQVVALLSKRELIQHMTSSTHRAKYHGVKARKGGRVTEGTMIQALTARSTGKATARDVDAFYARQHREIGRDGRKAAAPRRGANKGGCKIGRKGERPVGGCKGGKKNPPKRK